MEGDSEREAQGNVASSNRAGMSKTEVIRCIKRYVARGVFAALQDSAKAVCSAA